MCQTKSHAPMLYPPTAVTHFVPVHLFTYIFNSVVILLCRNVHFPKLKMNDHSSSH